MKFKAPKDYTTAISRLEEIISKIEDQELNVDTLANYVSEANELIKYCSAKLKDVNKEVENLLEQSKLGE